MIVVHAPQKMQVLPLSCIIVFIAVETSAVVTLLVARPGGVSGLGVGLELIGYPFLIAALALLAWWRDLSPIPVQELEKRKVFEIARGELLAIKLKEHVFNASQIEFTTQDKKREPLGFSIMGPSGMSSTPCRCSLRNSFSDEIRSSQKVASIGNDQK